MSTNPPLPRDIRSRTREIITANGGLMCNCAQPTDHMPLCKANAQWDRAVRQAWRELRPKEMEE